MKKSWHIYNKASHGAQMIRGLESEREAVEDAFRLNCRAIDAGLPERWEVGDPVEEPEPVDMGRVAYEAWMQCNDQCRDARWSAVAAAVVAAAPPRELTDEEIRAGVRAVTPICMSDSDITWFRKDVAACKKT